MPDVGDLEQRHAAQGLVDHLVHVSLTRESLALIHAAERNENPLRRPARPRIARTTFRESAATPPRRSRRGAVRRAGRPRRAASGARNDLFRSVAFAPARRAPPRRRCRPASAASMSPWLLIAHQRPGRPGMVEADGVADLVREHGAEVERPAGAGPASVDPGDLGLRQIVARVSGATPARRRPVPDVGEGDAVAARPGRRSGCRAPRPAPPARKRTSAARLQIAKAAARHAASRAGSSPPGRRPAGHRRQRPAVDRVGKAARPRWRSRRSPRRRVPSAGAPHFTATPSMREQPEVAGRGRPPAAPASTARRQPTRRSRRRMPASDDLAPRRNASRRLASDP